MWAIETCGLTKVFRSIFGSKLTAVDNLSLQVPVGTVFGFLGPNGAGKTTTLNMLLGNVRPTNGTAKIFGLPISNVEVRRQIGFLPEKFQFHDFLTAEEFLNFHAQLYGIPHRLRQQRIRGVLKAVGLFERRHSKIREYSKGMQQRLGIAQALINEPNLVILDEPTSGLDPIGRRDVRDIILALKEQGVTVFLNSHLLSEVEMTCDAVGIINKGKLVFQGTMEELLQEPLSLEIKVQNLSLDLLDLAGEWGRVVSLDNDRFEVQVRDENVIPDLVSSLVAKGARIVALIPKRHSLEDMFIKVVGNEGNSS